MASKTREARMASKASSMSEQLGGMSDRRRGEKGWHGLINSMSLAMCGAIGGADKERVGTAKQDWFTSCLDFKQGMASDDTFGRVL